jgi:DNA-binding response OmpR family regulator
MARVLIVDDDLRLREQLYDALSGKGHAVATAGTGEQALEMLKAQRPDLVLLDVSLPKLSGPQTAHRIRAFDTAVPIVLWHAPKDDPVAQEEVKSLDIADVLSKDTALPKVLERLEVALAQGRRQPGLPSKGALAGRLLIVDDDPQVQSLLKTFFQSKGLRVMVVGSGEEALKAIAERPVLVLLDVNMPGMDGVMALKKIKAQDPKLPVVVMSGGGEEAMARAALGHGAYDYISKPFNLEYLETVVLTKVLLGIEG